MPPRPRALGALVLVPNTLDLGTIAGPIEDVLADGVLRRAASIGHWVVEDARSARRFLKRVHAHHPLAIALQSISVRELPRSRKGGRDEVPMESWRELLAPATEGHDIGLLSEAGLPAVADPGAELVTAAHAIGIPVQPLAGPSALGLALAASGLGGQHFAFVGYLPQEPTERLARVRELEATSRSLGQVQIAIETPYRNAALLDALLAALAAPTRLAVAAGLTLAQSWVRSATVSDWRTQRAAWHDWPHRLPAVFALRA